MGPEGLIASLGMLAFRPSYIDPYALLPPRYKRGSRRAHDQPAACLRRTLLSRTSGRHHPCQREDLDQAVAQAEEPAD